MQYMIKILITIIISALMQSSAVNMVSTTPKEAVTDFLSGLKARESMTMEKYMDNSYVNFLVNVQGDDAVTERMNEALFSGFSYEIGRVVQKNKAAVAEVTVRSIDYSSVLDGYETEAYAYVMDNLYTEEIADKEKLEAKCLEIYVEQIEKAAETGNKIETLIYIPMVDDGYYGWNVIMTDELMRSVLGNLQMPEL